MNYWLFKSEPSTYSIDDLKKEKTASWEGVRNYQARNMLRDDVKKDDLVFIYHSNCKTPGITGIAKVVKAGYPDFTAFDEDSPYFDAKSHPDSPRWFMVDVKFVKKFRDTIALSSLRTNPKLKNMLILRKGNRLSITPLTKTEWDAVLAMDLD